MTTLQPGESKTFTAKIPEGEQATSLHLDIAAEPAGTKRRRVEDLDDNLSIAAFWLMSAFAGVLIGWSFGAIV